MTGLDRTTKASLICEAALDLKAQRLVGLDVKEVSSFADIFILATGTSDRHLRAIADSIHETLNKVGERPLGVEGYQEGGWILIDCDDIIVHLFLHDLRDHYDLERLWCDAPLLELESAEQSATP